MDEHDVTEWWDEHDESHNVCEKWKEDGEDHTVCKKTRCDKYHGWKMTSHTWDTAKGTITEIWQKGPLKYVTVNEDFGKRRLGKRRHGH